MPSGSPEELCVFRRKGWTGKGAFFARSYFAEEHTWLEPNDMGVYVLWQDPDETEPKPRVYIGEGHVSSRLTGHETNKEFWIRGAAFIGTDLHKTLVQHLETQLIGLARNAGRCKVENKNMPTPPTLSDSDGQFAQDCLNFIRLCMRVTGIRFFETPEKIGSTSNLYLKSKGIHAIGYESTEGFVVLADSTMVRTATKSIHYFLSAHRDKLLKEKIAQDNGKTYKIKKDYAFKSPSDAAGVLLGGSTSGLKAWKDENGRTLKEIRQGLPLC